MNNSSNLFANRRIRVIPDIIRRVKRSLEGRGTINVQIGEEVMPPDVIGRYTISGGYRRINLAQILSCNPYEVGKFMQRQVGQRIYKGEVLAFRQSMFLQSKKIVVSPMDGVIDFYDENTGELSISFLPKTVDLPAAVYGIVELADAVKGEVIIRTQVTDIVGILGTGKSRDGVLQMIGERGDLINGSTITEKASGKILVGGSLVYIDGFTAAISLGVRGIITGGINVKDYKSMTGGILEVPLRVGRDVGISVAVTEGFGSIPMGEDIYEILLEHNEKFVILDGNGAKITLPTFDSNSMYRVKSTQLPRLNQEPMVDPIVEVEVVPLQIGQKVRVIGSPFMGEQGFVLSVDNQPTMLSSGINAWLITVETKSRKFKVPHANVEIIGQ